MNVSGHLLSTAEVEAALVEHPAVAETAAVSIPHVLKGECIYCFIVLKDGYEFSKDIDIDLKNQGKSDLEFFKSLFSDDYFCISVVRTRIGAIAAPEVIHLASALPKTRSGKIMRRILRKIARDDINDLGDTSTLADETILDELINSRILYVMGS